jgi:lambda repressor-like predicted transcriptional regulator
MIHTSAHIDPKKVTHLDYVRGLLTMHKITFRSIGKSLGISHSCVSHVLHGRGKSRRVLQAVADALGMTFEELWGKQP